jgi:HAD superfamily hydrolase (TIGR01509 family)
MIRAVVFDLDGVLLDSEPVWDRARRAVVTEQDGRWREGATEAMQGMSSLEWSAYLREHLGVALARNQLIDAVVAKVLERYEKDLPLLPDAVDAVRRIARRWPLGLASSANRIVIDRVLSVAGLAAMFKATVSSEEVPRGKPAPDVYVEAARRLGQPPERCAAVEDSANGILSAATAGLWVVAVPNRSSPAPATALARADHVIDGLAHLTPEVFVRPGRSGREPT